MNSLEYDSQNLDCLIEDVDIKPLAERILGELLSKYDIEDVMKVVGDNKSKTVYIVTQRSHPEKLRLVVDDSGKYSTGEVLSIPIPKKFAILEPDKNYFEQTLRANIFLAVMGAEEKDLHR